MRRILHFIAHIAKNSINAFFITISIMIALWFPLLLIIGVAAIAGPEDKKSSTSSVQTSFVYNNESSKNKILVIPIDGVIYSGNTSSDDISELLSDSRNTYGYEIKQLLRKVEKESSIKGIILEINSPGGTIVGSQAIYDGIKDYKEKTNKPVVAHISGIGASGAYWVASAADAIYADVGSSIGSIGVINGGFNYYDGVTSINEGLLSGGVTTKNGIQNYTITAGKGKDLGNPFRKPTEEELKILQQGADNNYYDFVKLVSISRNIPAEKIRREIGAYIYDNQTAIENNLIDNTYNKEQTYATITTQLGLGENYQIVKLNHKQSKLEAFLGAINISIPSELSKSNATQSHRNLEICSPYKPLVFYGDINQICSK